MLAYGQGRLESAIDDWRRVVKLHGATEQMQAFLRAAETELRRRRARIPR